MGRKLTRAEQIEFGRRILRDKEYRKDLPEEDKKAVVNRIYNDYRNELGIGPVTKEEA